MKNTKCLAYMAAEPKYISGHVNRHNSKPSKYSCLHSNIKSPGVVFADGELLNVFKENVCTAQSSRATNCFAQINTHHHHHLTRDVLETIQTGKFHEQIKF